MSQSSSIEHGNSGDRHVIFAPEYFTVKRGEVMSQPMYSKCRCVAHDANI